MPRTITRIKAHPDAESARKRWLARVLFSTSYAPLGHPLREAARLELEKLRAEHETAQSLAHALGVTDRQVRRILGFHGLPVFGRPEREPKPTKPARGREPRRRHSYNVRREIARRYCEGHQSVVEIAALYGIGRSTVRRYAVEITGGER